MKKIRIKGRREFGGVVEAEALVSPKPLEGFANVDSMQGYVTERNHPLFKVCYTGKVLVYPSPRGSGGLCTHRGKRLKHSLRPLRPYSVHDGF